MRTSIREYRDDHCPQLAAAISYHLLFSMFPLAIAGVGVLGLVARDADAQAAVAEVVLRVAPLDEDGQRQLRELLTSIGGRAGGIGLLGLVGVLWSATGVMTAVRTAVNVAWDVEQRRPFVRGKAVDLLLVAGTLALLATAFGTTLTRSRETPRRPATVSSRLRSVAMIRSAPRAVARTLLCSGR